MRLVFTVLFVLGSHSSSAAANLDAPPIQAAEYAKLRQWHELRDWEPVWKAGLDGEGVVVVFVGRENDRGAVCDGREFGRFTNVGESNCRDGVDDDANGCIDDCRGCNFSPEANPEQPHGGTRAGQYPYQCYDMKDFVGPLGVRALANRWDQSPPGRFPALEVFTVVYPPGSGARVRDYLQHLVDAHDGDPHLAKRFIVVHKSRPSVRQPLTQEDCNAYAEHPPRFVPSGWIEDVQALASLERALLVIGWVGGDRYWPACSDPAAWLSMGLVRAPGGRPENQLDDPFPISPGSRDEGYYALPAATQAPRLHPQAALPLLDRAGAPVVDPAGDPVRYHPLVRFVGYSGTTGPSFHSWQYVATLTYLVPMLQVLPASRILTEDEVRDIWLRCAPRRGALRGPDGVEGWDPRVGYGQPSIACSVLEGSRRLGGDIDRDGVLDGGPEPDNCPWVPNPDQKDVRSPGGAGDACDRAPR